MMTMTSSATAPAQAGKSGSGRTRQAAPRGSDGNRLEQRALLLSVVGVLVLAGGSVIWGLIIDSDIVILNGVFSMLSAVSGGLSLLAARLVVRPEDRRFPFGYAHVEPLVHTVNGVFMLLMCLYAALNGIEGMRHGGHETDAEGVILFAVATALFCLAAGAWEWVLARRIGSQLMLNDAKEWLMDAAFSLVTFAGFAVLPLLPEPQHSLWARYADPAMVTVLSLLFLLVPIDILRESLREVLRMAVPEDELVQRIDVVLADLRARHDIVSATHHVVRTGRTVFVEIDFVVGPRFTVQRIAQQDQLREEIRAAIGISLDEAWLTVSFFEDPRWT
ncbi:MULTISPECIES: cation diffusion facilitator family transporter [Roseateles]|uniref:Cation diffusion facilitator family transporter n=1 Tax=Roseateles albus TaxID=2987525 RepID=A0ABT5KEH0_9BURK|nr:MULTISPECIES: cation diffusion facilitator family transporter [Roseateles]MCV2358343.1 cation diffusion facilitator family transporter [Paucibacter sp. TC2R-5]MDC8772327.1 cation diffusion facilitator family transporter [Roseateles albus]